MTKNERQPRGMDEAMSVARGAYQATRIAKAASTGAAVGGIWGAAAGAAWESRKHIGRLVAASATLLMLPVLFLILLPSLIFGGLTNVEGAGTSLPSLNDAAAIDGNLVGAKSVIDAILAEGIEDAKERISSHFSTTEGDAYEIANPYEDGMDCNVDLYIAAYCAAKNEMWRDIALSDMENVLRAAKDQLFSYTFTTDYREVEDDDPETKDVAETKTELWYLYTITYNGDAYLADHVFHLTDPQKALAEDYARNLSVFLGDGAYQGPTSLRPVAAIASLGNVTYTDGATNVVYFNQYDERYANKPYGTDNVGHYGCGPTSMAIVVSSLSGERVDPAQMAEWAYQHGCWCKGQGSYRSLIPGAAEDWGLTVSSCGKGDPQRIVDALSEGKLVVAIMSKGHFTQGGHFIVLRGVNDGKILVADPASRSRSEKTWDLSLIVNEASGAAASTGPFWIIGT